MRTLLVIVTAFPPAPEVGALRTAKLVSALPDYGWKPVVITVASSAYTAPRDTYGKPIRELPYAPASTVEVRRVWGPNPIAMVSSLRSRGASRRPAYRPNEQKIDRGRDVRGRIARLLTKNLIPDEYAFWVRRAVRVGAHLAESTNAEAVFASFPAAAAVVAGARLSKVTGLPFIVDYRDPWENYGAAHGAGRLRMRIERNIRRRVLEAASAATAVSDHVLRRNMSGLEQTKLRTLVLPQGWDPVEASNYASSKRESESDGVVRLVHGGTLYPTTSDPEPFIRALAELVSEGRIDRGRIIVSFVGQVMADVKGMARRHGIEDLVESRGTQDRDSLLRILSRSDVLLAFRHAGDKSFLSGKVWDYLTVGRPILAIVARDSSLARLVEDGHVGLIAQAGDMQAIKDVLSEAWRRVASENWKIELTHGSIAATATPVITERFGTLLNDVTQHG